MTEFPARCLRNSWSMHPAPTCFQILLELKHSPPHAEKYVAAAEVPYSTGYGKITGRPTGLSTRAITINHGSFIKYKIVLQKVREGNHR